MPFSLANFLKDVENRRAKQIWITSHNLIDSVINGRRSGTDDDGRRKPLAAEVIK